MGLTIRDSVKVEDKFLLNPFKGSLMNREPFHYLTIDPVNAATAEELAEQNCVLLELAEPRDLPRLEKENALLIVDWDFIPPDYRDRVLASTALRVIAVHGYNVPSSVATFPPRRDILCYSKLGPELFQALDGLLSAA